MRTSVLLLFVLDVFFLAIDGTSTTNLFARQVENMTIGSWRNHTDMKSIRGIATQQGDVIAATGGGLFRYRPSTNSFTKVTNAEGLGSNDLTAVTVLPNGDVWTGGSDGVLSYFKDGTWRQIRDIRESPRTQKGVRNFLVAGNTLYITTDFGIVLYRLDRLEFGDTYANLGFSTQARVNDLLIHGNQIWAATDQGVAVASVNAANLSSPTAWTRYLPAQGLPNRDVQSIAVFRDTVLAGTASGLAYFNGSSFSTLSSFSFRSVTDLLPRSSNVVVLSNGGGTFFVDGMNAITASPQSISQRAGTGQVLAIETETNRLLVGTVSNGILFPDGSFVFPNGTQSNLFVSVAVDGNGVVWGASGISGRGTGFYRYNPRLPVDRQWKNFTVASFPVMADNDYYKVSVGDGSVWASSWGTGVVEIVADTIRRRIHHASTPRLAGTVPQNPAYVVVGSVAPDPTGAAWFVNRTAINGNYLAKLTSDTSFSYYANGISPTEGRFTAMVIDQNGTKWLANSEPQDKPATGLWYFNESRRVAGTEQTGGWGNMMSGDGLPNNSVLSLAIDFDGDVCVGTDLGMMIITDPLNPKTRRTTSFPLREQVIQAIAADALNNKWVGTKEGVFVVNSDGTQLLHHYSVLSTGGRLLDNDVRSIAIDQQRGIVYFGTEKGLSSLSIEAVRTLRNFTTLELGPNPYLIPNITDLVIGNLVTNSTIKILSVSGALVSQFPAQGGGRAFWNGRDGGGEYVPTGVYFVVAFAENGEKLTTGKVAVVRK